MTEAREILTLNDGTELDGYVIEDGIFLWVYLNNMRMATGGPLLMDPEKTKVIKANRYGEKATYTGFDHLHCISEENNGQLSAGLKKG